MSLPKTSKLEKESFLNLNLQECLPIKKLESLEKEGIGFFWKN